MNVKAIGTTVEVFSIKGGRHLRFNCNSTLFKERGITDMWCYTKPEAGEPMLYLEGEKGNLIREFNLKNQLEQVRYYFNKANAPRNQALKLNCESKEINQKIRDLQSKLVSFIREEHSGYRGEDITYYVEGIPFASKEAAQKALIKYHPELSNDITQLNSLRVRRFGIWHQINNNPYCKKISQSVWNL